MADTRINTRFVVPPQVQREERPAQTRNVVPPEKQQAAAIARNVENVLKNLLGRDGLDRLEKAAMPVLRDLGLAGGNRPAAFPQRNLGFETRDLGPAVETAKPVPAPGTPPVLTQHGGAVLDKPVLDNIYLGDYWNTAAGQADRQYNDSFAQDFGQSGMSSVMKQYGAGASTFAGSTVVGGTPKTVTEADVQDLVKQQLAAGSLSKDPQAIHTVILPPGTILDAGGGVTSQNGLGGFHGSVAGPDGNPVYYAVIAYSDQQGNGIDFNGNSRDNISITESHEWSEAETDPDVNSTIPGRGLGWYDDQDNGEIGDLAMSQLPLNQVWQRDDKGFAQQIEWSNQDQSYEIQAKDWNSNPTPTPTPTPTPGEVTGSASPGASFHGGGQQVSSTIHIDQDVNVSALKLGLDLQHSRTTGLSVTVTSPSGTTATVPIQTGKDASGTFDLSAFAGESSKGDWKLTVQDNGSKRDRGTLNSWNLDITGSSPTPTPTPTPTPGPIVLPDVPNRPSYVTEIEGILTINKYEGIQHGRNGDHEIAEATLTLVNAAAKDQVIDTKNIHVAMNVASAKDPNGLPHEIPLVPGEQIEVEGEYIPASRANATNDNGSAAVIHFTHQPAGYVIIDGQKYE